MILLWGSRAGEPQFFIGQSMGGLGKELPEGGGVRGL